MRPQHQGPSIHRYLFHSSIGKHFLIDCQILPEAESPHAQFFLYNQFICHQLHEPAAGERSLFSQGSPAGVSNPHNSDGKTSLPREAGH